MDPMSRLDFAKIYTVEHNVKVFDFGDVHKDHIHTLKTQWRYVLKRDLEKNEEDSDEETASPTAAYTTTTHQYPNVAGRSNPLRGVEEDDDDEEDDEEDDDEEDDYEDDDDGHGQPRAPLGGYPGAPAAPVDDRRPPLDPKGKAPAAASSSRRTGGSGRRHG